ncbi:ROK family protein [Candidatus Saccharibacteria bacterium]|nr:ROK family protein [Candidatus Saccharibacteria bacterium]
MYLGIDIGGSKTLLAVFTNDGKLSKEHKFATNPDYRRFLDDLAAALKSNFADFEFDYACCAVPGRVNRKAGIAEDFGNLKWHNVAIKNDVGRLVSAPILVENDAKLGGLSEALLVHKKYKKILYVTISTGIGGGIIINGKIDPVLADMEPGHMLLEHDGKLKKWEDFASGRAFREKYGKLASEINDQAIWKSFAANIALGLEELLAIIHPDVVIIGGGVGAHYEKFGKFLDEAMKKNESDMVKVPPIIKAQRPEEAVIYGCYEYVKQNA